MAKKFMVEPELVWLGLVEIAKRVHHMYQSNIICF